MPQTDYKLKIDDQDVEKSLKDTQDEFDKMGKSGDDAMKKVGKSAKELGDGIRRNVNGRLIDANGKFVSMGKSGDDAMNKVAKSGLSMSHVLSGAVGGAITAVAAAAIDMAKAAVAAFAEVIKSSTQAAIEFDLTRKKFISIFEGQDDFADAVMDKIGIRASKLGLDMNEALSISRAFLPDVKGTEDPLGAIDDLLVGVRALAEEDPMQGVAGARVAIDEAMSGSLRSIRQRFEFTKTEVEILEKAQGTLGQVVGTIEGINLVMKRRGVDVEALKGTFTQAMGEMQFATGKLRVELGKPIAEQMTDSMGNLNKILAENSDDLALVAASIGDVVANVVDFVESNLTEFLDELDFKKFVTLGESLTTLFEKGRLITELLFDMGEATPDDKIEGLIEKTDKLTEIFNTGAQAVALIKAEIAAMTADLHNLGNIFKFVSSRINVFAEDISLAQIQAEHIDSNEAFEASMRNSLGAMEDSTKRLEENKRVQEERKAAQDKDTEAALAGAEAYLKLGDAASQTASQLAELGLAEEDLDKIQEDVIRTQEKLVDAEETFAQERLDIASDFLQERADLELEFSQERSDTARQSLQDIADIEADHQQSIENQGLQLGRNVRDMGKKQGEERAEAEKDLRRNLLDVEQDFQDELRRIQRTAQQSMEEAERGLDAKAFVAALRQQEVSLEEAAITREGAEADVRDEASQRLKDLEQAQAEERATLQQADRDKLEDLQIQLAREFEAQALSDQLAFEQQVISEQRRVEQQTIDEQRRLEQQTIDEERQLEALVQGQAERLAKMVEGLDAETAAVVLAEANKLAAVEDFAGASEAILDGLIKNVRAKEKQILEKAKKSKSEDRSPRPIAPGAPRLSLPIITKKTPAEEAADRRLKEYRDRLAALTTRRFGGRVAGGRRYRVGEAGLEGYIPHRLFGGSVLAGQPTVVGEFEEELFIPPSSGTIIPNNEMGSFLDGNTTSMAQSISNTENNLGGFTVSQSMLGDPVERAKLEQFMLEVLAKGSSR